MLVLRLYKTSMFPLVTPLTVREIARDGGRITPDSCSVLVRYCRSNVLLYCHRFCCLIAPALKFLLVPIPSPLVPADDLPHIIERSAWDFYLLKGSFPSPLLPQCLLSVGAKGLIRAWSRPAQHVNFVMIRRDTNKTDLIWLLQSLIRVTHSWFIYCFVLWNEA